MSAPVNRPAEALLSPPQTLFTFAATRTAGKRTFQIGPPVPFAKPLN
jgi:hypothetical protein